MADELYPRNSAVFYRDVYEQAVAPLEDRPELHDKVMQSMFEYSFYGTYKYQDDPVVSAIMARHMNAADISAARYDKAKENGQKGGQFSKGKQERFTNEDVYNYYKRDGHTLEQTCEYFGYKPRTIQDKCKKYLAETNRLLQQSSNIEDTKIEVEKKGDKWIF